VTAAARPWGRAALWLLLLGPFFFASYGFATWVTAQRAQVPTLAFGWETAIPFIPWTILPYWSIDLLYGISLFLCTTRAELDTHGRRLLTAQVVAVACFLAVPLRFGFDRPAAEGWAGALFDLLGAFDKPFNQLPSLHIALLVILWVLYARHVPRRALWPLHAWFALIGISVLTTWQHHFVDVPTGAALGLLCLWAWPDGGPSPLARARLAGDPKRRRLALRYGAGAVACAALAPLIGGWGLWLAWPALALGIVALGYAALGPQVFQKRADGRLSLAAALLLAPYLAGAWVNTRLWPGDGRRQVAVADGVALGRLPSAAEAAGYATVVDLCAELPGRGGAVIPMLDLVPPAPESLRRAAAVIEASRAAGPVLVCCALGYSRSAAAVATWLVATRRAPSVEAAVATLRAVRPHLVLDAAALAAIRAAA
jgi:hypothetical protein